MHLLSHHLPRPAVSLGWSRDHAPALIVPSGAEILVDAPDCSNGQVGPGATADIIERIDWDQVDLISGPIFVEGAQPGDVLQVDILGMELGSPRLLSELPGGGPPTGGLPRSVGLRVGTRGRACALPGRDLCADRADDRDRGLHACRTRRALGNSAAPHRRQPRCKAHWSRHDGVPAGRGRGRAVRYGGSACGPG